MYRLSSYFMSRMASDLPMELLLPTVFTLIAYWMVGLKSNPASFFATLFSLLFNVLVAQGIGLAIGSVVMDLKSATTLASVIMLTSMLAGGFFVQRVPVFIRWIKYVSVAFHTFHLFVTSQYTSMDTYACSTGICRIVDFPSVANVGVDRAYLPAVIMIVMFFVCRIIAYLALMRVGVPN